MNLYGKISPIIKPNYSDFERLVTFDPSEVYSRIKINPILRRQSLSMIDCFPNLQKGYCACGCGLPLPKRATRWADTEHSEFLANVMRIIHGDSDLIRRCLSSYSEYCCTACGKQDYQVERWSEGYRGIKNISYSASGIHVDHIVSVKNGGGGCWLGNYQFLCHTCNIQKEQTDRLKRNIQQPLPFSTLF